LRRQEIAKCDIDIDLKSPLVATNGPKTSSSGRATPQQLREEAAAAEVRLLGPISILKEPFLSFNKQGTVPRAVIHHHEKSTQTSPPDSDM
jgi:hypothetical protein